MEKNEKLMKAMPWLLIVFGFLSLTKIPAMIGWGIMGLGIVWLIERRWPEKWGTDE